MELAESRSVERLVFESLKVRLGAVIAGIIRPCIASLDMSFAVGDAFYLNGAAAALMQGNHMVEAAF